MKKHKERYCFAKPNELYLVYLNKAESVPLDLSGVTDSFEVKWFHPRTGGKLQDGSVKHVKGGDEISLGAPPADPQEDWLVLVEAQ